MIHLAPCPKAYSADQDKAVSPRETLARVKQRLESSRLSILSETRRIDAGRLGIPVFLSVCGSDARLVMPTRKQMGKGASVEQAEASALMELMERYGFFTFWQRRPGMVSATWNEAEERFGPRCMDVAEVVAACQDTLAPAQARALLNLRRWAFFPVTRILDGATLAAPLDLFRQLGEFNGSSAGNTDVESILQGACELVERHVCCLAEEERPALPTIDPASAAAADPVLAALLQKFRDNGISVLLKDFSMGMPVPTVAVLAVDPATFPETSEIVYTAGTAASPVKAAIRALTEVAQLAGDFCTSACYEASGLPKYEDLAQTAWLQQGDTVSLASLPSVEAPDIFDELTALARGLSARGHTLYSIATTSPETGIPTHYSFVPGFRFRERDSNASLGLFAGRMIVEGADAATTDAATAEWPTAESAGTDESGTIGAGTAKAGTEPTTVEAAFAVLETVYPRAHFIPFFRGMLALRAGEPEKAREWFAKAEPLQPGNDARALAAFYHAYTHTLSGGWEQALPGLDRAVALCPDMKEYLNLRGVCLFKLQRYAEAARDFQRILTRLDKGSIMDICNLGMCHARLGHTAEARHFLSAALELDPALDAARETLQNLPE